MKAIKGSKSKSKPGSKPAAKTGAKPAAKVTAKPEPKTPTKTKETPVANRTGNGVIEDFTTIPAPSSNRSVSSSYDFANVAPGKALFLPVTGETKEEKQASAERQRSNLFAAFYRYNGVNPESKQWKRAIRIVPGADGLPERVGFYREA